jgi:uncharacterized protein (DUF2235 family)
VTLATAVGPEGLNPTTSAATAAVITMEGVTLADMGVVLTAADMVVAMVAVGEVTKTNKNKKRVMSKKIIFCCDGTWDSPQNDTNVYTLYNAITTPLTQVKHYDSGVGTDGTPLEQIAGGAFGDGLFQKIKDGYTYIFQEYEQGDDIFIFGFSRGAYTARSLAGMIAVCGIPTANFDNNMVNAAFNAYRNHKSDPSLLVTFNAQYAPFDAKIKMVGVWDTVGALGIPAIFGQVDPVKYGFLDTSLHPDVLNAYQALAIDERRQEFPPTLWIPPVPPVAGQVLEQVWFSGVHCDVGGGYPETGLSDITLGWMMSKAVNLGLEVDPNAWAHFSSLDATYPLDLIHESWNMLWLFPRLRTIATDSTLGNSVVIRCEYDTPYQPQNLTLTNDVPAATYDIERVVNPAL